MALEVQRSVVEETCDEVVETAGFSESKEEKCTFVCKFGFETFDDKSRMHTRM